MPISGGKYVAPTWHNNAAPAIDATELQAMSDTLEGNDVAVAALQEAISGAAKVAIGSYVGTGSYGQAHPNTLTFDFEPKLLIIQHPTSSCFTNNYTMQIFVAVRGVEEIRTYTTGSGSYDQTCTFTWDGNSVSWFVSSRDRTDDGQFNGSGVNYLYIAIG